MTFYDIILDIDMTLVHTPNNGDFVCKENLELEHFVCMPNHISFKRPHLDDFMMFLFRKNSPYRVSVWTAGEYNYAVSVLNHILPPNANLYAFLTRESVLFWEKATNLHKPVHAINIFDRPLIVDDREDVYTSQSTNAYKIKPFQLWKSDARFDTELIDLMKFLGGEKK